MVREALGKGHTPWAVPPGVETPRMSSSLPTRSRCRRSAEDYAAEALAVRSSHTVRSPSEDRAEGQQSGSVASARSVDGHLHGSVRAKAR
jgi:hypothetical protein